MYVKIATVTQVPGLLTLPAPLHVAPSGAAAAETRSGHQVAPPRLAAPGTFRAHTVGGAEAARCVSGSAGRVQTPGWRGRGHRCESPKSSRSVVGGQSHAGLHAWLANGLLGDTVRLAAVPVCVAPAPRSRWPGGAAASPSLAPRFCIMQLRVAPVFPPGTRYAPSTYISAPTPDGRDGSGNHHRKGPRGGGVRLKHEPFSSGFHPGTDVSPGQEARCGQTVERETPAGGAQPAEAQPPAPPTGAPP